MNIHYKLLWLATLIFLPWSGHAATTADMAKITGVSTNDLLGHDLAKGDINGDGFDDLIMGSYNMTTGTTDNGAINIIYGSATPLSDQTISASNVITYTGEYEYDWAGLSVGTADIDNDGYDDILIGAPQEGYTSGASWGGAAYIIYGSSSTLSGGSLGTTVRLSYSQATEYLGYDISSLGDVDQDGYEDFAVGALFYDASDTNNEGAVYVVYGSATRYTSTTVSSVATRFTGEAASDALGSLVQGVGDINDDGYADWITGAPYYGATNTGAVYIVYGSATRPSAGSISQFPRLTGETQNDYIAYAAAGVGDLNNDGITDMVIADNNGNANSMEDNGQTYIIYGSTTAITSQSLSAYAKLTGAAASDLSGYDVSGGNLNGDDYADFVTSAPYTNTAAENAGTVFLVHGQSAQITSTGVATQATTSFNGEAAQDNFGLSALLADMNGDGYMELIASSTGEDTGANSAGAVYVGYLRIDLDEDGVLGSTGLLETGTDCNDSDSTVSDYQTYYLDEDGDGLGMAETTTSVCSSTPPTGYADNANDTNDDIKNNDQEIDDDGIDNDGDGQTDEQNTVDENGGHPEFESVDPTEEDAVNNAVVSVRAMKDGRVAVRFVDDTVYVYTPFRGDHLKRLKIKRYPATGYYAVMLAGGNKIGWLNVLNGEVLDKQSFSKKKYVQHYLQFSDLRDDDVMDFIIASKKGNWVRLATVGMSFKKGKFIHPDQIIVHAPEAVVAKTTVVSNTIDIRSQRLPLITILVNKQFDLKKL